MIAKPSNVTAFWSWFHNISEQKMYLLGLNGCDNCFESQQKKHVNYIVIMKIIVTTLVGTFFCFAVQWLPCKFISQPTQIYTNWLLHIPIL